MTKKLTLAVLALAAGHAMGMNPEVGTGVFNLDGTPVTGGNYSERNPSGVSYSVYTGLTNAANQLFLIEVAGANGDLRTFGAPPSGILPYIAAAGGVTRTVTDTSVANPWGGFDMQILVTGSGNLFPAGFVGGGNPLTGAGVGLGLNLGTRGNAQLVFPNNQVDTASVSLIRADGSGIQFALPRAFFPNSQLASPWNGAVGVSIANIATAANATNPFVQVLWEIRTVPTPGITTVLALSGLIATRRRR